MNYTELCAMHYPSLSLSHQPCRGWAMPHPRFHSRVMTREPLANNGTRIWQPGSEKQKEIALRCGDPRDLSFALDFEGVVLCVREKKREKKAKVLLAG